MDQQFRCQYCKKLIKAKGINTKLNRIDPTISMIIFNSDEQTKLIEMQPINNCLYCLNIKNKKLTKYLHDSYHINYLAYKNFCPIIDYPKIEYFSVDTIPCINKSINRDIKELEDIFWEEYNNVHSNDLEYKINPDFELEWKQCIDNWSLFYELKNWKPTTINWLEINWILSQMVLYSIEIKTKIDINLKWKLKYQDCESSIINTITEEEYPLYYNDNQSILMNLLISDSDLYMFNRGLSNLLDYIWTKCLSKTKNYKRFDSNGLIDIRTKKSYKLQYFDLEPLNVKNFLQSLMIVRNLLVT